MESKELRKVGLKVTLPRLKILEILEANRVLTQFESAGLVRRHNFEGGSAVFELDDGAHHDHIICQQCGHVEEFFDPIIEEQQEKAAAKYGFTVSDHTLVIYGTCTREHCPHLAEREAREVAAET
jgi:Fur family ferric uptake transcriptional regulator